MTVAAPEQTFRDECAAACFMEALHGNVERQCEVVELIRLIADDAADVTMDGIDPDVVEAAQDLATALGI